MATPPDFTAGQVLTAAHMDAVGLWLVKTQTIGSGVATVTITDAFSADYENYKIVISNFRTSGPAVVRFQFNGLTTTVYDNALWYYYSGATGNSSTNGLAHWEFGNGANNTGNSVSVDVFGPNVNGVRKNYAGASYGNNIGFNISGQTTDTASRTGFVLSLNTGTYTSGTIRVYGYRN